MILETSPSSSILTLCLLFDFPVTCCLVSKLLFAKGKGQAIYHTVLQGYALLGFKSNPIHIGSDAKPTKLTVNIYIWKFWCADLIIKGPFKYYVIKEVGGWDGQMMIFDDRWAA